VRTVRITKCKSCQAPIVFARTRDGYDMPLDAEPSENGNALLSNDRKVDVLGPLELLLHDREAQPLRVAHFVTCPDGEMWRRR
jgi:hypothetical protein